MATYKTTLTKSFKKGRVKQDYTLIPIDQRIPLIKSQPIRNTIQYTFKDKSGNELPVVPNQNRVKVLQNTAISLGVIVEDPSNVQNPYDISNLRFVWKQDGSELYSITQLNGGKGLSSIYLEKQFVTPSINGTYTVEITNDYGTVISDSFVLEVINLETNKYFYKNLIKNDNAARGLDEWTVAPDIKVQQFYPKLIESQQYASILGNFDFTVYPGETAPTLYEPELPFAFSSSPNWVSFGNAYSEVKKGNLGYVRDSWWYRTLPPNLIENENPNEKYAAFFPSPYYVDRTNANTNQPGSLVSSLDISETYFTRDSIKFNKYGGQRKATMTQLIDLVDIEEAIDGNIPGIDKVATEFFAYVGVGISKYEYVFTYSNGTTRRINASYIYSTAEIRDYLNGVKLAPHPTLVGGTVVGVDIIPICSDRLTVTLVCLDQANNQLNTTIINGPDELDAFAIKEKFFLAEQFGKLIQMAIGSSNVVQPIPVRFFGQTYFNITTASSTGSFSLNNNLLRSIPYPQSDRAKRTNVLVDFLDKGVAGMTAIQTQLNIPSKTRSINVIVEYDHISAAYYDEDPTIPSDTNLVWEREDIYGENYSDNRRYVYNTPKTGITQMKLVLYPNKASKIGTNPRFKIPAANIIPSAKADLLKDVHNSTNKDVYKRYTVASAAKDLNITGSISPKDLYTGQEVGDNLSRSGIALSNIIPVNVGGSGAVLNNIIPVNTGGSSEPITITQTDGTINATITI